MLYHLYRFSCETTAIYSFIFILFEEMKIVFFLYQITFYTNKKKYKKDRNKTFKKRDTFYPYIIMYIANNNKDFKRYSYLT